MPHLHVRIRRGRDVIDEYIVPPGDELAAAAGAGAVPCASPACRVGWSFSLRRCRG
ncbi:MAG: hypothetical protein KatS3mg064_2564 [Tepidiforma sp.]|nr:hypothetical protein [Tepidiforma sp.]GIW19407.1 MAG: hypothetical protein KatS3mg064_2564 [Tepidiforma sp.]